MRESLIQLILEEMKKPKHGIFRSPMITSLLNVIIPSYYLENPIGRTEQFLTSLKFFKIFFNF